MKKSVKRRIKIIIISLIVISILIASIFIIIKLSEKEEECPPIRGFTSWTSDYLCTNPFYIEGNIKIYCGNNLTCIYRNKNNDTKMLFYSSIVFDNDSLAESWLKEEAPFPKRKFNAIIIEEINISDIPIYIFLDSNSVTSNPYEDYFAKWKKGMFVFDFESKSISREELIGYIKKIINK